MKMKVGAAALLMSLITVDGAFAGYFNVIPEFDGSSSIAVIALLATFMAVWLASLIVAVVIGIIGYAIVSKGMSIIKHTEVAPQETIETVREDVVWLTKRR